MGDTCGCRENRILGIDRAESKGKLNIRNGFIRLTHMGSGEAAPTVSGSMTAGIPVRSCSHSEGFGLWNGDRMIMSAPSPPVPSSASKAERWAAVGGMPGTGSSVATSRRPSQSSR